MSGSGHDYDQQYGDSDGATISDYGQAIWIAPPTVLRHRAETSSRFWLDKPCRPQLDGHGVCDLIASAQHFIRQLQDRHDLHQRLRINIAVDDFYITAGHIFFDLDSPRSSAGSLRVVHDSLASSSMSRQPRRPRPAASTSTPSSRP